MSSIESIKIKLEKAKDWQEFRLYELGEMLDTAMEHIAALEAVAEAAREARKELVRPLKDGETLFTCTYRAKEILRVALEKAGR